MSSQLILFPLLRPILTLGNLVCFLLLSRLLLLLLFDLLSDLTQLLGDLLVIFHNFLLSFDVQEDCKVLLFVDLHKPIVSGFHFDEFFLALLEILIVFDRVGMMLLSQLEKLVPDDFEVYLSTWLLDFKCTETSDDLLLQIF